MEINIIYVSVKITGVHIKIIIITLRLAKNTNAVFTSVKFCVYFEVTLCGLFLYFFNLYLILFFIMFYM